MNNILYKRPISSKTKTLGPYDESIIHEFVKNNKINKCNRFSKFKFYFDNVSVFIFVHVKKEPFQKTYMMQHKFSYGNNHKLERSYYNLTHEKTMCDTYWFKDTLFHSTNKASILSVSYIPQQRIMYKKYILHYEFLAKHKFLAIVL